MIITRNVKKLLPTLIFSLLIVALGFSAAIYIFSVEMPMGPKIFGMGICTLPLTPILFLFFFSVKRVRHDQPEIIIDDNGIYIWQWADKMIEWKNIRDIRQHGIPGSRLLSLKLADPDLDPPRKRKAKFFDWNRNFADKIQGKINDRETQIGIALLSPAAAISLNAIKHAPDHRDPIFHANGTDATFDQLLSAVTEHWTRSSVRVSRTV
jgi:hypothetical protein